MKKWKIHYIRSRGFSTANIGTETVSAEDIVEAKKIGDEHAGKNGWYIDFIQELVA